MNTTLQADKMQVLNAKNYEVAINNELAQRFIDYSEVQPSTLKGYAGYIKQLLIYLKNNDILQPTREDIREYKRYLDSRQLAEGTKQQYFRACKHFFKWLSSENLYPNISDNLKGFKVSSDNTKKESFNELEIQNILEKIDTADEVGKRDYALILLSVIGGLRINELANILISDIQMIRGQYIVYILGKGHTEKDTYIKLIEPVHKAINDYLSIKKEYTKKDYLFTSTSNRALNKGLTKESISKIIKDRFRNAGYDTPKLTAHSLRHTSHTMLHKSGADLERVQRHARHKDPKTTEIYIHIADRDFNTDEEDIYNQIFNANKNTAIKELENIISNLNEEEMESLIKQLKR